MTILDRATHDYGPLRGDNTVSREVRREYNKAVVARSEMLKSIAGRSPFRASAKHPNKGRPRKTWEQRMELRAKGFVSYGKGD
jgi:hypothetical protein